MCMKAGPLENYTTETSLSFQRLWKGLGQQSAKFFVHCRSCNNMFADDALMEKISSLKFDLAVVENIYPLPFNYLLPHVFKIPYVS